MPIQDTALHLLPMTAQSSADIAPVAPMGHNALIVPGEKPSLLLRTFGNADPGKARYPGVLFAPGVNGKATPRPILPNTGNLSLLLGMTVSPEALTSANVIETDILIVTGGFKFNLSAQRHIATGQLDIGNWTDTGVRVGQIVPNHLYSVRWNYAFDTVKHVCSVLSYEADGALFPITLPPVPATPCNWLEGAYLQLQLGSLPRCNEWSVLIDQADMIWA